MPDGDIQKSPHLVVDFPNLVELSPRLGSNKNADQNKWEEGFHFWPSTSG